MQSIIDFFTGNGIGIIVAAFVAISAILAAVEAFLTAMGKTIPGWIGTAVSILGKIVAFINGNFKKSA